jgi:hypothetical protein
LQLETWPDNWTAYRTLGKRGAHRSRSRNLLYGNCRRAVHPSAAPPADLGRAFRRARSASGARFFNIARWVRDVADLNSVMRLSRNKLEVSKSSA